MSVSTRGFTYYIVTVLRPLTLARPLITPLYTDFSEVLPHIAQKGHPSQTLEACWSFLAAFTTLSGWCKYMEGSGSHNILIIS